MWEGATRTRRHRCGSIPHQTSQFQAAAGARPARGCAGHGLSKAELWEKSEKLQKTPRGQLGFLQLIDSSRRFPRKFNRELERDRDAGAASSTAPKGPLCFPQNQKHLKKVRNLPFLLFFLSFVVVVQRQEKKKRCIFMSRQETLKGKQK